MALGSSSIRFRWPAIADSGGQWQHPGSECIRGRRGRIMRLSGPNAAEITYYAWDAQRIIAEYNGRGTFHWEKSRFSWEIVCWRISRSAVRAGLHPTSILIA